MSWCRGYAARRVNFRFAAKAAEEDAGNLVKTGPLQISV